MKSSEDTYRHPDFDKVVLYSPSALRVIIPVSSELTGTIQLSDNLQTERVIYAAPIDMKEMSESWSNQDINDWVEVNITRLADLADSRKK